MKKIRIGSLIALVLLTFLGVWFNMRTMTGETPVIMPIGSTTTPLVRDYKNTTYTIDGSPTALVNGVASVPAAPGSVSMVTTRFFGNEVYHDFNADGRDDIAFLITQETGGSGTFYYLVAALNTGEGYTGSEGILIGDRIAPQTTEVNVDGVITVNYADRLPGEALNTPPSLGKSLHFKLDIRTMQFGEVVKNFEGEADSARMSLTMKSWKWERTLWSDGSLVTPKKPDAFVLTYTSDGHFSATTDCNSVGGDYRAQAGAITFSNMMSTLMYCDGSQESDFTSLLSDARGYHFTGKGELVFDLQDNKGTATFR